jgi:hypothetical protein
MFTEGCFLNGLSPRGFTEGVFPESPLTIASQFPFWEEIFEI